MNGGVKLSVLAPGNCYLFSLLFYRRFCNNYTYENWTCKTKVSSEKSQMFPSRRKYSRRGKIFTFCTGELDTSVRQSPVSTLGVLPWLRLGIWRSIRDLAQPRSQGLSTLPPSWERGWILRGPFDYTRLRLPIMYVFAVNHSPCFAIDSLLPWCFPPYTWFWLSAKKVFLDVTGDTARLQTPSVIPARQREENVRACDTRLFQFK